MRSIMNTFATFILLSISNHLHMLTWCQWYCIMRRVPFFDGNTKYFGGRHLPYAILAIVVLFFCSLFLLLLFLSPLKCFQRCVRWCCCSFRCVHFISAMLEVFQGHFKDGGSHRRDYWFVAGLQFLLRFILLAVFNSLFRLSFIDTCSVVVIILWTVGGLILRPYRRELHHILEAVLGTYTLCFSFCWMIIMLQNQTGFHHSLTLSMSAMSHQVYCSCLVYCHISRSSEIWLCPAPNFWQARVMGLAW